jgi:copper transport protein
MRHARFCVRLVIALLVLLAVPASMVRAHASLDNSVPASGATLVDSPPQIVLDFDETVETVLGFIRLFASDGSRIDVPSIARDAADGSIVRVDVPRLDDDTYVVTYRVVSVDGHAVDGALTFQVGDGPKIDVADVLAEAMAESEATDEVGNAVRAARLVGYLALGLVLAGSLFFLGGVVPEAFGRRLRGIIAASSGLLAVASVFLFGLQGAALAGDGIGAAFRWATITDIADTRVGHALLVRIAIAALLAICAAIASKTTTTDGALRFFAVLGFVVLPLSYSFAGHAGASGRVAPTVAVSMLHVAAVGTWFGGLVLLAGFDVMRDGATVKWFSQRAGVMVGVAVVSGVVQSLLIVDDVTGMLNITYGKMLVTKVVIVGAMLLAAAVVRRRFVESGVTRLRSALVVEAVVGVVVLGVTSGLVVETPRATVSAAPFATTLVQGDTLVNVTVSPSRVGPVEMHIIVTKPGGSLEPVATAKVRLSSAERNVPPIAVEPAEVGPNHFVATAQIPYAGEWKIDVVLVEPDGRESLVSAKFAVRP